MSLNFFAVLSDSIQFFRILLDCLRSVTYSSVFFRFLLEPRILSNFLGFFSDFFGFFPGFSDSRGFLKTSWNSLEFFRIFSDLFRILSDFFVFSRIFAEFSHILSDSLRFSRNHFDSLWFFRILSYSSEFFRFFSYSYVYFGILSDYRGISDSFGFLLDCF